MKQNLLYLGVIGGCALALFSIIYGVILPINRSRTYIGGLQTLGTVKTTEEFKKKFKPALEHPSPIGDEEISKFMANDILNIVSQNKDEGVRKELINFIEPYMDKENVRHLLVMAQMYGVVWQDTKKDADYLKAEEYLLKARSIGPKLPPVLYTLVNLYQAKGDKAKLKEVGETILRYWPNDAGVKELIN